MLQNQIVHPMMLDPPDILFLVSVILMKGFVDCLALEAKSTSFIGHVGDLPDLDSVSSVTLWIAPDDVIATPSTDQGPIPCPGSNLKAVVTRALRLTSRQAVFRPLCQEGLVLYKTKISVLVDANGPTYCAVIVSSADRLHIRDTILDHGDCVNDTVANTRIHPLLTADSTAAVVLRPRLSRLDPQTTLHNLTFQSKHAAVAVLLSPPTWKQTLQLEGPSFSALQSRVQGMRFVGVLVSGSMTTTDFDAISIVLLRDPNAGLDRTTVASEDQAVTDLWQYMDARVLMRLRLAGDESSSPSTCPHLNSSAAHSTTLMAIGFTLSTVLAVCVFILLVHSCRSTEAQDMAPYRLKGSAT